MIVKSVNQLTASVFGAVLCWAWALPSLSADADYVPDKRWALNMPEGVTAIGQEVFRLHMLIFWICVAISVIVFGAMFISMYLHRKSRGYKAATFHESTGMEILWTVLAFVILVGMAWPSTATLVRMYDNKNSDIDIVITGYQWKWKYEYIGEDVSFFSSSATALDEINNSYPKSEHYLLEVDDPLVLPVNKKIRFLVTAADVIHSWWVPELAVKRDAIPGFINETHATITETGIYRGQCAELCGRNHGFMPIVVRAVEEAEYNQWLLAKREQSVKERALRDQVFSLEELVARGEGVYQKNCASCHGAKGAGVAGVFPHLLAGSAATGDIAKHLDIIINGTAGTAMAAFGAQLTEADIAGVLAYERNAWGNDMGDFLQPLDVAKASTRE